MLIVIHRPQHAKYSQANIFLYRTLLYEKIDTIQTLIHAFSHHVNCFVWKRVVGGCFDCFFCPFTLFRHVIYALMYAIIQSCFWCRVLHKPKMIHTIHLVWWQADSNSHYPRCHHEQIPVMPQIWILQKINKFWNVTLLIEWKLFLGCWVLCDLYCTCVVFVCTNKSYLFLYNCTEIFFCQ